MADSNTSANANPNLNQTLEKLLLENLKEQRRKRRWGIFFKLIYLLIIVFIIVSFSAERHKTTGNRYKSHVALIKVKGMISPDGIANANYIDKSLRKAFKNKLTQAVILQINSPGGSPVQSDDVYNQIMQLRHRYPEKKVYAVCSDVCASGAYFIASAANDIYANPSSIVGSIGVLMNGFGFTGTMQKLGIQRRLITSGSEKGFLDPFSPLKPQDVKIAQHMLNIVHQQFITAVEKGRGKRLKLDSPLLFSGLAWTGLQAKQMGLIDGFGDTNFVASKIIKNTNIVNYTHKPNLFQQLGGDMGASFAKQIGSYFGLNGDNLR